MTDRRRGAKKTLPESLRDDEARSRSAAYAEDHVDPFYVDKIRQVVKAIGKQKVLKILEGL